MGLPNVLPFAILTAIGFALVDRRWKDCFARLGLTRPQGRTMLRGLAGGLLLVLPAALLPLLSGDLPDVEGLALAPFAQAGLSAGTVTLALIYGLVYQALGEELFFRGFLLGQLQRRLPFAEANLIQASAFSLLHLPLLALLPPAWRPALAVVLPAGLFLGWLRRVDGRGSILPSIIIHGLVNALGYVLVMSRG